MLTQSGIMSGNEQLDRLKARRTRLLWSCNKIVEGGYIRTSLMDGELTTSNIDCLKTIHIGC